MQTFRTYDARRQQLGSITSSCTYHPPETTCVSPKQALAIPHCIKQVQGVIDIFPYLFLPHF